MEAPAYPLSLNMRAATAIICSLRVNSTAFMKSIVIINKIASWPWMRLTSKNEAFSNSSFQSKVLIHLNLTFQIDGHDRYNIRHLCRIRKDPTLFQTCFQILIYHSLKVESRFFTSNLRSYWLYTCKVDMLFLNDFWQTACKIIQNVHDW